LDIRYPGRIDTHVSRSVLGAQGFRAVLRRERARSNRYGQPFVVLGFVPRTPDEGAPGRLDRLAQALSRRVRTTDVLGQIEAHELGLLLRHTSVTQARRLALTLLSELGEGLDLHCTIYPYPPLLDASRSPLEPRGPRPLAPLVGTGSPGPALQQASGARHAGRVEYPLAAVPLSAGPAETTGTSASGSNEDSQVLEARGVER